ncbi:hypothetical protein HOA59_01640 [archaeon]|jgi:pheromone shutdown-related protein TraB|nr:hypothetical protein [archaeon]MBT6824118.1 hypothetical protein [archaeon]MBT7107037.1 hypothetical protein [archaeon]MBT7297649.1 hypothetical protein [archaeon]
MLKIENLFLIGSSHIAKESVNEVKTAFSEIEPDIVALELDQIRLYLILNPKKRKNSLKDIRSIGLTGYIFNIIGAITEKKMGKLVGMEPGAEMKEALKLAKQNNTKISLIDQDIRITLKRLSEELTIKEKMRFAIDIFGVGLFKKQIKEIDLTKVPDKKFIKKLTNIVKKRYPSIYKVLIKERDKILAKNLNTLITNYPDKKILAIVGAGHEDSIIKYIKNVKK